MLRLTVSQSVSMSWCQVHSGTCDQILFCLKVSVLSLWGALFDKRSGLSPVSHCHLCGPLSKIQYNLHFIFVGCILLRNVHVRIFSDILVYPQSQLRILLMLLYLSVSQYVSALTGHIITPIKFSVAIAGICLKRFLRIIYIVVS
jgi:hypothetical protein